MIAPGGIKGTGKAKITGSLSYNSDKSEFFFKDPTIEKLEVDNVSDKLMPKVKKIAQLVASKMLATRPVYKLKDDNLKHKLAKSVLQSILVKDGQLLAELSVF